MQGTLHCSHPVAEVPLTSFLQQCDRKLYVGVARSKISFSQSRQAIMFSVLNIARCLSVHAERSKVKKICPKTQKRSAHRSIRGLPSGYVSCLEQRLRETELALFETLSSIYEFGERNVSNQQGFEPSPFASNTETSKAVKIEEWERLPLLSHEQRQTWWRSKSSNQHREEERASHGQLTLTQSPQTTYRTPEESVNAPHPDVVVILPTRRMTPGDLEAPSSEFVVHLPPEMPETLMSHAGDWLEGVIDSSSPLQTTMESPTWMQQQPQPASNMARASKSQQKAVRSPEAVTRQSPKRASSLRWHNYF